MVSGAQALSGSILDKRLTITPLLTTRLETRRRASEENFTIDVCLMSVAGSR